MVTVYIHILFSCVFIYVLSFFIAKRIKDRSKYLKNIPGPKPIFPFGNTLDAIPGNKVILKTLMDYLAKYGDTIIVHDGAFSWAVMTIDYEFTEFLLSSNKFIDKAAQYEYLHSWLGQGLLTSTGPKWRSHRKAITPAFHFSILKEFIGVFDSVGDTLIETLRKEVGRDSVEISKTVSLYALDVICEAAMGVKVNSLKHETTYIKNIKTMCVILADRTFSPLNSIFYPLTLNYYKEKKAVRVIRGYVDKIINKRIEDHKREEFGVTGENDEKNEDESKKRLAFLDLLLKSTINGRPLNKEELRDEVNTFMFEGHDTTSAAISFCMLMLATHPQVQEKAFKEQQELFENDLRNVRPTYQQLNEMKYLDLVIKETLRLFPSVPFFGRTLSKDLEFKGTLYPKGLDIMIFPFAFQRNPKFFPEPEKFIPERFLEQTGKMSFSYTPFSAGPRNCIGQKFAMLEMLSTVSKVLRNFELRPATPEHKIQLAPETILVSKNGVKISIRDRC